MASFDIFASQQKQLNPNISDKELLAIWSAKNPQTDAINMDLKSVPMSAFTDLKQNQNVEAPVNVFSQDIRLPVDTMPGQQTRQAQPMQTIADPTDISSQFLKSYSDLQRQRSESIKQAEERLAAAQAKPEKFDLSPLIALADMWGGNTRGLLSIYNRPEDKQREIEKLQEAVLKSRGGAAETELQAAKNIGYLNLQNEQVKAAREDRIAKREQQAMIKNIAGENKELDRKIMAGKEYGKRYGDQIAGLTEVTTNAQKIKNIINDVGGIPTDENDPRTQEYRSAVSNILTGFNRDVARLGALAGADKELLVAATGGDVTRLDAYFRKVIGNKGEGTIRVLDNLLSEADKLMERNRERVKAEFVGYANEPFETSYKLYKEARSVGAPKTAAISPDQLKNMTREQKLEAAKNLGR